jgi:hypothetical protein
LCLNPLTGHVYVIPHVVFDETKFFFPTPSLTSDSQQRSSLQLSYLSLTLHL